MHVDPTGLICSGSSAQQKAAANRRFATRARRFASCRFCLCRTTFGQVQQGGSEAATQRAELGCDLQELRSGKGRIDPPGLSCKSATLANKLGCFATFRAKLGCDFVRLLQIEALCKSKICKSAKRSYANLRFAAKPTAYDCKALALANLRFALACKAKLCSSLTKSSILFASEALLLLPI